MSKFLKYIKNKIRLVALYLDERREYNKGICPDCGKKLQLYYIEDDDTRCYICDNCVYAAWVSLDKVDEYK